MKVLLVTTQSGKVWKSHSSLTWWSVEGTVIMVMFIRDSVAVRCSVGIYPTFEAIGQLRKLCIVFETCTLLCYKMLMFEIWINMINWNEIQVRWHNIDWCVWLSGVATGVARRAECHPWQRKNCQKSVKNRENSGKIGKKEEKSGRIGKNREVSFTLPLLTDRAGYATGFG